MTYAIIEAGTARWAIVEYDRLGPILRFGPYYRRHLATYRLQSLLAIERKAKAKP